MGAEKAEDVVRAVQEGQADEVGNKLDELQRKVDELVREGKISPSAVGGPPGRSPSSPGAVQRSG